MEPSKRAGKLNSIARIRNKRYSFKNLKLCPDLQKQLIDVAIPYIIVAITNALLPVKQKEFVDARNDIDIPHGLFGFNLEDCYARVHENNLYLDILGKIRKEKLNNAYVCIILDSLHATLNTLLNAYNCGNISAVLNYISDINKVLSIKEDFEATLNNNIAKRQNLLDKHTAFLKHEKNALDYMNQKIFETETKALDQRLAYCFIEYRYKLDFYDKMLDQQKYKLLTQEEELLKNLSKIWKDTQDEKFRSQASIQSMKLDIITFKRDYDVLKKKYEEDYDEWDSRLNYSKTGVDMARGRIIMFQNQFEDLLTRLEILKEWKRARDQKEHEEARALIRQQIKENKLRKKMEAKLKKEKANRAGWRLESARKRR